MWILFAIGVVVTIWLLVKGLAIATILVMAWPGGSEIAIALLIAGATSLLLWKFGVSDASIRRAEDEKRKRMGYS